MLGDHAAGHRERLPVEQQSKFTAARAKERVL
jgi:hypothetical protein